MNGLSLQLMKSLGAKLLGQQLQPVDSAAKCSYITPNILAIGRMTEDNAESALAHLHGCRFLVWNLTGSPVAPGIQQKLMRQIVNIPWEKFAYNIPTIVDMLNLCYALSSWLSFDIQNVAVFYYGDLPPVRPGILFACYQKYVNGDLLCAFDAFAQYCHDHNIELAGDAIPCSLRKFFDNFDQVVSNGGFPNTVPYLLRRIVIQGLPVDEMPLLEVRECSSTSTETYLPEDQAGAASWTGEDGSFAFNKYVCGEFAIICYFGGEHYWRPNNSTLIFKLHDNTGLLPAEPLRIQKNQVDIPLKDHRDIIDGELFAVDIFFEQPFDIDAAGPKRLPKDVLCGYEAFVGGVACLSSWHTEEISFAQLEQLAEEGFDTNTANLSLQIANNNLEVAMDVAKRLREHLFELRKQGLVKRRGSDVIQVGAVLDRTATELSLPSPPSSSAVSPRMSPRMRRTHSFASRSNSSSGNSTSRSSMGRKRALTDATCAICNSDDILKRAQLISCSQCRRHYHTYCAGEPAIPFKLSTATEKQHHSNYVKQRFGNWRCTVCVTGAESIVADHCSAVTVAGPVEGTRSRTASTSSTSSSPILDPSQHGDGSSDMVPSRAGRRSRDTSPRAAPAMNSQKSNAESSQASPASGSSGTGRSNAVATGANDQDSPAGTGNADKDDHADLLEAVLSPRFDRQRASSHAGTPNTRPLASAFNRQHGAFADSPDMELARQIIPHLKQLQRIGSVEELLQRPEALAQLFQVVGATQPGSPPSPGKASRRSSGDSKPASVEGVPLGEHPLYGKYFKMVKVGLPVDTAKHKLRMEHPDADPSLLDQSPSTRVSLTAVSSGEGRTGNGNGNGNGTGTGTATGNGSGNNSGEGQGPSDRIALKDHPVYGKYFKMLKVGLPVEAAKQKLRVEHPGVDDSLLDQSPDKLVDPAMTAPMASSTASAASNSGAAGNSGAPQLVALKDHPVYGKYVKMLKVGLPLEAVKQKLRMEHPDADASVLDQNPDTQVPLAISPAARAAEPPAPATAESGQLPLKDHPIYGKFFKMLKVGLPKGAVQQKLLAEFPDADAAMLDRDPESLAPVPTASAAAALTNSSDQQVALKDHPTYGKFFKMMKVGMPKQLVKQKLQAEFPNADCSMLEESPDKLVVVIVGDQKSQTKKIALKDHPIYGRFFKMLKVGIPKEVVKKKLAAEHPTADLTMMDQDPDFLVEEKPQTMMAAQDHPLYQKYFKMLKVGLPAAAVKAKMALEGLDQSVLDKPPETMIPVEATAEQAAAKANAEPPAPKVRRRKLHWKPIPADRLNDTESIWAGVNENTRAVHIDLDEFEKLFVARETPGSVEEKPRKAAAQKVQRVTLIEAKRAQNCAIALARIKMAYSDMAERIRLMEDRYFTGDQLTSLLEFVPTQDDIQALKGYTGDRALLGEAEKFMLEMVNVPKARDLIAGMAYMQQFSTRVLELKKQVAIIDNACDDVKLSMKLRKVLAIVLKLGNFMNQEQQLSGFTLDSLLKLRTVKGFDQKTSMLHYLVRLVKVNDEAALDFKSDLTHVPAASRVVLDSLVTEKAALRQGFEQVERTAREALGLRFDADAAPKRDLMREFEQEQEQEQEQKQNEDEGDRKEQKEQAAKISKQERIEQIRHRRTQTRISKSAHGQQLIHFDAALEVTPPSGSTPAAVGPRPDSAESQQSEQQSEQQATEKQEGEKQEAEKQEGGAAEDSVPKTPQAATASDTAASSRHQRRSSARSDRTAPLPEHNVLDFIHNASERLDELDRAIDALVQKFQSVLAFFGEDPKMQSHEFFNTLSAFVAAFVEAHDQVQRIEKSKERQKKQEEALEQRKLLRRASQPAMKIGSKQQEKPKESATEELVGGAAQEGAVVEQSSTADSNINNTEKPTEITAVKADLEKTDDAVTDDQQANSEDAMSMRPSQAESTSDSESVHSVQSLTLDGEVEKKQPPKPTNIEACEHAA